MTSPATAKDLIHNQIVCNYDDRLFSLLAVETELQGGS